MNVEALKPSETPEASQQSSTPERVTLILWETTSQCSSPVMQWPSPMRFTHLNQTLNRTSRKTGEFSISCPTIRESLNTMTFWLDDVGILLIFL
ncbi:hypothetical protein LXL04_025239 [Taraxacum kok-saghyz]